MKSKSTLTIRVPEDLKQRIESVAAQQGVSINQFALYAFAKEIGEIETAGVLRAMAPAMEAKEVFRRLDGILARVPDRPVEEWDSLEPRDGAR